MRLYFTEDDLGEGDEIFSYSVKDLLPYTEEEYEDGDFKIPCYEKTCLDPCRRFYETKYLPVFVDGDDVYVLCRKGDRCETYDGRLALEETKYLSQYSSCNEEALYAPYGGLLCEKEKTDMGKARAEIMTAAMRTRMNVRIPASRVDMEKSCIYLPVAAQDVDSYWRCDKTPVYAAKKDIRKIDDDIYEVALPDAIVKGSGVYGETLRPVWQIRKRLKAEVASIEKRRLKKAAKECMEK